MTEPINIEQINIELAGNCNLKCKMCTQAYGREEEFLSKLPIGLFYKAVDETIPLGLKYVSIGGSGEPLLYRDLEVVVKYLSDRNIESLMYTNLITLKEDRFKRLCDAGLGALKISAQGWDRDSYKEWMSIDAFDRIRENVLNFKNIAQDNKYPILIQTNHLIHDVSNIEYQRDQYVDNWVNYLDVQAEIWLDHNWSGGFNQDSSSRFAMFHDRKRRSCGRPLSSVVEIRAGGLNGKHGSIVPCPNVLGMDSAAVMGNIEDSSIVDVLNGLPMKKLKEAHLNNTFDHIDYCKNCDQLLDISESLVWTNIPDRKYGQSRISGINYIDNVTCL